MVCIFKITHYGFSGNDLPPPPTHGKTLALLSMDKEPKEVFTERMRIIGSTLRQKLVDDFNASKFPSKCYTCAPSISWEWHEVAEAIGEEDLI